MNGVQTRFKCKLDVKRCKRFVFPPSSLLPRSNALKTKAIRYFQTDRTLTRIVSPPLKDFWKDHKKMYQNRPIYWLFASKKGAFQCIAYMHRMNAYTAERIRAKYLLPYIETLQARITDLDARRSELTTRETKQLQQLTKTLEECQEYHDRLQVVAEQAIAFDLDDGVVVNYAKFGDVVQRIK